MTDLIIYIHIHVNWHILLFNLFFELHTIINTTQTSSSSRPITVRTKTLKSIKLTQHRNTQCMYGCVPEVYLFVFGGVFLGFFLFLSRFCSSFFLFCSVVFLFYFFFFYFVLGFFFLSFFSVFFFSILFWFFSFSFLFRCRRNRTTVINQISIIF